MNKKLLLFLIVPVLFFFNPANPVWGQRTSNTPSQSAQLQAPDFSLKDLNGKVFRLSSQRGKPVLLFFGTTWCPSCRQQLPLYKEIYSNYTGRGLEVIYINIMEPQGKVAKFVSANALPFRILLDESGEVADNYNIIGVPTIIMIDRKGKIIKVSHSTDDLPMQKLFPVKNKKN
jgi:peroxiredoxin